MACMWFETMPINVFTAAKSCRFSYELRSNSTGSGSGGTGDGAPALVLLLVLSLSRSTSVLSPPTLLRKRVLRFFLVHLSIVSALALSAFTSLLPCGSSIVCDSTTSIGLRCTMRSWGSITTKPSNKVKCSGRRGMPIITGVGDSVVKWICVYCIKM